MRIETSIKIEAPPAVVFRFYSWLDHLRFVSSLRRREWCPERESSAALGEEYEVEVRQGRHAIQLRFKTVRYELDRLLEDECKTWPVGGAMRTQIFLPEDEGKSTLVRDMNQWEPPWFARAIVQKHEAEQRSLFELKLANAKKLVEAVYAERGEEAFVQGIEAEALAAGFQPISEDDAKEG